MSLRYCSGVFFLTRFLNSHIVFLSIWYAILISVFKIIQAKTDAVDCFFAACRGSLISNTGQGRKTTVTIAITTNQQRNSSQSKTANNTKTYVYIGVGAGALLVGTGGAISLIKWIHKKKSQQRVTDVDSSWLKFSYWNKCKLIVNVVHLYLILFIIRVNET